MTWRWYTEQTHQVTCSRMQGFKPHLGNRLGTQWLLSRTTTKKHHFFCWSHFWCWMSSGIVWKDIVHQDSHLECFPHQAPHRLIWKFRSWWFFVAPKLVIVLLLEQKGHPFYKIIWRPDKPFIIDMKMKFRTWMRRSVKLILFLLYGSHEYYWLLSISPLNLLPWGSQRQSCQKFGLRRNIYSTVAGRTPSANIAKLSFAAKIANIELEMIDMYIFGVILNWLFPNPSNQAHCLESKRGLIHSKCVLFLF